jgi:hypothetical protein
LVSFRGGTTDLLWGRSMKRICPDFWHTKYQRVKLPAFSALASGPMS